MRKKILTFVMSAFMAAAHAQSVSDMFVTMPDSMFPYLAKEQRGELVNLKKVDPSVPAELRSIFDGTVALTSSDDDLMTLMVDSAVVMELARLGSVTGDSVYCLLRTVRTPEWDTSASIYNKEWIKVEDISFDDVELVHRPDTMTENKFQELQNLIEFRMVEAHFEGKDVVALRQSLPLTTKEERKRLNDILMQRKLKWDGKRFNIY
ncbi:MAG: DUF3256 family protein [Prevotellaceae bacterium]|nr:DUF3256 family protein [Prevotellaceae bacterium]